MIVCDLTTRYSIDNSCFQHLKLKYGKLLSSFAININLRRYTAAPALTATNYAARRTLHQAGPAAVQSWMAFNAQNADAETDFPIGAEVSNIASNNAGPGHSRGTFAYENGNGNGDPKPPGNP